MKVNAYALGISIAMSLLIRMVCKNLFIRAIICSMVAEKCAHLVSILGPR